MHRRNQAIASGRIATGANCIAEIEAPDRLVPAVASIETID